MSAVPRSGLSRYAYQGRHRTPDAPGTAVRSAALGAGVVAAVMVGTTAPATAAQDPWYLLRMCESGGNYAINTGNGYYGAYQFDAHTWRAYGGRGLPHQNSPAEQDLRAKLLYRDRGWAPWPACSRKLGLRSDPSYGAASERASRSTARTARPVTVSGPAAATLQSVYRITGTAAPSARITLKVRVGSTGAWHAYPKRADRAGRFSVPWRARTDYQYQVVGATRSAVRGTRVAATVTAAPAGAQPLAAGTGPRVAVGGTAKPGSRVVVYVRGTRGPWRAWAKLSTGSTGAWSRRLEAPSRGFTYYAVSTNGERSAIRSMTV